MVSPTWRCCLTAQHSSPRLLQEVRQVSTRSRAAGSGLLLSRQAHHPAAKKASDDRYATMPKMPNPQDAIQPNCSTRKARGGQPRISRLDRLERERRTDPDEPRQPLGRLCLWPQRNDERAEAKARLGDGKPGREAAVPGHEDELVVRRPARLGLDLVQLCMRGGARKCEYTKRGRRERRGRTKVAFPQRDGPSEVACRHGGAGQERGDLC